MRDMYLIVVCGLKWLQFIEITVALKILLVAIDVVTVCVSVCTCAYDNFKSMQKAQKQILPMLRPIHTIDVM